MSERGHSKYFRTDLLESVTRTQNELVVVLVGCTAGITGGAGTGGCCCGGGCGSFGGTFL